MKGFNPYSRKTWSIYERKNIIVHEKNFKPTKNISFNNIFCNRIFPYYHFLPIFKNDWIFINHGLFFGKNTLTTLPFSILKVKFSMADIIKIIFWKETFFYEITIFENYLLILKIGNDKVVENIFPEKMSHNF